MKDRLSEFRALSHGNWRDEQYEMVPQASTIEALEAFRIIDEDIDRFKANVNAWEDKEVNKMESIFRDEHCSNNEDIFCETKALCKSISNRLKAKKTAINDELAVVQVPSIQLKMRQVQVDAQLKRFRDIWVHYNALQVDIRNKQRFHLKNRLAAANADLSPDQIDNMIDTGNLQSFGVVSLKDTTEARRQLNEVEVRHSELMKLEKSLAELHSMFMDISTMVESQSEMIDRISCHVTGAAEGVSVAKTELDKAHKYQISTRKNKMLCLGLVGVVIIVLVLIIVLTLDA